MSTFENRTTRLILRPPQGERDVAGYAASHGWIRDQQITLGEEDDEILWSLASGISMHFLVNSATGLPYIYFTTPLRNIGVACVRHAEQNLTTIRYEELIASYDTSAANDRQRTLLELALGSPRQLNEESFSRITAALEDPRDDVRKAAVHATAYTPSRRYRPYLRRIAGNDPKDDIKRDAANMLRAYDAAQIGEVL